MALERALPVVRADQLSEAAAVVDLRSPAEFAEDHVPGAFNVPLFDDLERAVVGTLYRQTSPDAAFDEARRIAEDRIEALVAEIVRVTGVEAPPASDLRNRLRAMTEGGISGLEQGIQVEPASSLPPGATVLHCWRGGLRSRSVAAFLTVLGVPGLCLLDGGYKSYRRRVLERLETATLPRAFVLRGLTGVGKTLVLRELERIRPGWTVDLEGLAGHRSSILGMVGLEPCTQKTFDSRLVQRLEQLGDRVVYEGESRKVGDVIVPVRVWESLRGGTNFELVAPVARRVEVLVEDYLATDASREQLRGQLPFIEQRLGPVKWRDVLVGMLDGGREDELVEVLLEHYYDPLYRHSEGDRSYAARIDTSDPPAAATAIAEHVDGALAAR